VQEAGAASGLARAAMSGAPTVGARSALRVGLFVPCYVDQLRPDVGLATLELLEAQGLHVDFPFAQTCCGQPWLNSGSADAAARLARRCVEIFRDYDYVVAPSASCIATLRVHYAELLGGVDEIGPRSYELCEFLCDVLGLEGLPGRFPHRVGLHESCHGMRELGLGGASERSGEPPSRARRLLSSLDEIELTRLDRPDECCGFGGVFAIEEEAVSCLMGMDRVRDHERSRAEILTSSDLSCLLHLEGLIRRHGAPLQTLHVAQILAGREPDPA